MSKPQPDVFDTGNAEFVIALATYLPPIAAIVLLAAVIHGIARLGLSVWLRLHAAFPSSGDPAE